MYIYRHFSTNSAIPNPPGIGREATFGKRLEGGEEVDVVYEIADK